MKPVRIAMLGSGFVADFYMQGLADVPDQQVAVNDSRSAARAEAFARKWRLPEFIKNIDALIARDDLDLYIIALPNEEHLETGLKLANARRNQVCTKPQPFLQSSAFRWMAGAEKRSGQIFRSQGRGGRICLCQQGLQIERSRDHRQFSVFPSRPLFFGQIPIQFHAIVVRVAKIKRVAYAMVGRALQGNASMQHTPQGVCKFGPSGIENRQMIQARRIGCRSLAAEAFPGVQADMMVVAASG